MFLACPNNVCPVVTCSPRGGDWKMSRGIQSMGNQKSMETLTRSNKVSPRPDATSERSLCFIRMSHVVARLDHVRETGPTKTSGWTQVNDVWTREVTISSLKTLK